jgi:hypothetical protein
MAALRERLRIAVPAVILPIAIWSALAGFVGLWPGPQVEATLLDWFGFVTMRAVITGTFVLLGLGMIAALLPLVIVVNVLRKIRG